jgi:hypothetical protein
MLTQTELGMIAISLFRLRPLQKNYTKAEASEFLGAHRQWRETCKEVAHEALTQIRISNYNPERFLKGLGLPDLERQPVLNDGEWKR